MLVRQLPEQSRVVALRSGLTMPWSVESEALATIADLLYVLVRVTVAAYGKKGAANSLPRFEFPRPVKAKPKPVPTMRGFALLETLAAGDGRG